MKSRIVIGLIVVAALAAAPAGVHAQFGGLLKKKAGEILKGKPAPTETKPDPAPTPSSPDPAPAPAPSSGGSATPAPAPARAAAPAPAKSTDPLDAENMNLASNINRFVRDEDPVPEGEWNEVPYFGSATTNALKALDDAGRVAFVEKAGAAIKALVASNAFAEAHAVAIKQQYQAVDHGLTGVQGMKALSAKKDYAGMQALGKQEAALNVVENAEGMSAADIKRTLGYELESWRRTLANATGPRKAKYERFVKEGEAIIAMSDVDRMRRGFAVLRSTEYDGFDTEAALYAAAEKARAEKEQVAWDEHNLRGVLRQQLAAFVKVAGSVDFAAATVEKNGSRKFVNAAYEQKGNVWKACFRAGKAATTAAQQFAQAWLKEL